MNTTRPAPALPSAPRANRLPQAREEQPVGISKLGIGLILLLLVALGGALYFKVHSPDGTGIVWNLYSRPMVLGQSPEPAENTAPAQTEEPAPPTEAWFRASPRRTEPTNQQQLPSPQRRSAGIRLIDAEDQADPFAAPPQTEDSVPAETSPLSGQPFPAKLQPPQRKAPESGAVQALFETSEPVPTGSAVPRQPSLVPHQLKATAVPNDPFAANPVATQPSPGRTPIRDAAIQPAAGEEFNDPALPNPTPLRLDDHRPQLAPATPPSGRPIEPSIPVQPPKPPGSAWDLSDSAVNAIPQRAPVQQALPIMREPEQFNSVDSSPLSTRNDAPQFQREIPDSTRLTSATVPAPSSGPQEEIYEVQAGDNYWIISRKSYGTARFFAALAEYNKQRIARPEQMKPGMMVLIPPVEVLHQRYPQMTGGGASAASEPAEQLRAGFFVDQNGQPCYRVGEGDVLTDIAEKHLGRSSRWVQIYGMNRERIPNADALKIGTVLRLPGDASQVMLAPETAAGR